MVRNDQRNQTKKNISGHLNRALAQNFEAVLAVVVILVVDLIFAKNGEDAENHIPRLI